ncbi:MAG: hypothetical protein ACFFCM_07515 [Promethearchaeota archaeon]
MVKLTKYKIRSMKADIDDGIFDLRMKIKKKYKLTMNQSVELFNKAVKEMFRDAELHS